MGLPNLLKMIDDLLVASKTLLSHVKDVIRVLEICRTNSFTLGRDKFFFAKASVSFAGFLVGRQGVAADPEKIKAIASFPTPKNITCLLYTSPSPRDRG